jgi:hypothetical protein
MMRQAQQRLRVLAAEVAWWSAAARPQPQSQQHQLQQHVQKRLFFQAAARQQASLRPSPGYDWVCNTRSLAPPALWPQQQLQLQQQLRARLEGAGWWGLEWRACKHSYAQVAARSKKSSKDTAMYLVRCPGCAAHDIAKPNPCGSSKCPSRHLAYTSAHGWWPPLPRTQRPAAVVACPIFDFQGAIVLGMIGVSYAMVPLYRMFCQVLAVRAPPHQSKG